MSLLLKDGAATSFRARVEGWGWTLPLNLNSLASRNSGVGESTLSDWSWDFPCFNTEGPSSWETLQSRANWDIWAPHSGVRKCEIISVRRTLLDSVMLLVNVMLYHCLGVCMCVCVCVCVAWMCVFVHTESTITIHSSCVLRSHVRHWISKHGSTASKGNTGVGSQKPPATYFHQLINT